MKDENPAAFPVATEHHVHTKGTPMNDLIKRLRAGVLYGDARLNNPSGHNPLRMEAADRLTAMKAAGDGLEDALGDLLGATEEVGYVHYAPFRAKARAALKQWEEARDGL